MQNSSPLVDPPFTPVLIGIDWGSTHVRSALLDEQGQVLERRHNPNGIFKISGGNFATVLEDLCGDWIRQYSIPILACGMIGSRHGIIEAPYVECPAYLRYFAAKLSPISLDWEGANGVRTEANLWIVPGLKVGSQSTGWDVIRGEETQILGIPTVSSLVTVFGTFNTFAIVLFCLY